ncbi:MAG: NUDIX domain-containing protein [Opitutae bacterium]|nr:NUDIX domain-containing protein [Opitutae bacterium]
MAAPSPTAHALPPGSKRVASLCLVRADDRYLLLRRIKEPHVGLWVPMGGKVDPFENPRDAAIREIREESGLQLEAVEFCGTMVETSPLAYNWCTFIYVGDTPWVPAPASNEGTLGWFSAAELGTVPTHDTDRLIYRCVLAGRKFALNVAYDSAFAITLMTDELTGEKWAG